MEEKVYKGKIVSINGPVVDCMFENNHIPSILSAVKIHISDTKTLTCEVLQHIGNDICRTVSMGSTDGLTRNMLVTTENKPISVPVGEKTLGRMFNVLGEPIDNFGDDFASCKHLPIHRQPDRKSVV